MARKPLSIFTYYIRNKRKAVPVIVLLVLAVFIINVMVNIIGSINGTFKINFENYKYVTQAYSGKKALVNDQTITKIKAIPEVKEVFKISSNHINVPMIAGDTGFNIFLANYDDAPKILSHFQAKVAEGHLPGRGTNEVALSRAIINAKNLKIGSNLDDQGKFKVSGIIEGPVRIGIGNYEFIQKDQLVKNQPPQLLILPDNPNQIEDMNKKIRAAFSKDALEMITHQSVLDQGEKAMQNLDTIVGVMDFLLILVMAISVGLLNYIYLMQRMNEFGTLEAIGYTPGQVIARVAGELSILTVISFILGIAFSSLIFKLLDIYLFSIKGWYIDLISIKGILFSIPIPVVVLITGLATVLWRLLRLDPVAIIERRD